MPVSTPNRIANPVQLERYDSPCKIRQANSLSINYYNRTGTTILPGEPVMIGGRVGLAQDLILPTQVGPVVMDWIADCRVDPALSGVILANAQVWWSYDITTVVAGVGGVVKTAPTNGFIFGLALSPAVRGSEQTLSTSSSVAATAGDLWIRVTSNSIAVVAIGTVPTFN